MTVSHYDKYLVMFSGGKDSIACVLHLLEIGIPKDRIELWHHDVDGAGRTFMDWEVTPAYCRAFAAAFVLPIFFSWKVGGFEREMTRHNSRTAPVTFEDGAGNLVTVGGDRGKENTRMKFPQVSPDLSVRWCSSYLKIDVAATAIRNQERFIGKHVMVVTGERGEESAARACYNSRERDRTDLRDSKTKPRHVDHWRPVLRWKESEVWAIIERHRVRVHPCYYLGFSRCSCKFCIFGNADQFASAFKCSPEIGASLVEYENQFGMTIKRGKSLVDLVASGTPYDMAQEVVDLATAYEYNESIFMDTWTLPAGAYGHSCGPA